MADLKFPTRQHALNFQRGVMQGLRMIAFSLQRRVKKQLSKAGSGKWYKGNRARSSRYNQPPVTQTGMLRNSWTAGGRNIVPKSVKMTRPTIAYRQVPGSESRVPYAYFLEYGTRNMASRPFIRPAVAFLQREKRAERIMEHVVRETCNRLNRTL